MRIEWTCEDQGVAEAEGWGIFDCRLVFGPDEFRIEKLDEADVFDSDYDAQQFVLERASAGSAFHRMALLILERDNFERRNK